MAAVRRRLARRSAGGASARSTVMLDTPWIRVVSKRVALGPDAPAEAYFVVECADWAMICPRTRDGRFVVVEQYRPAIERRLLEFPAGRIDPGETPAASIRRELIEETGHKATRLTRLGRYFTDTGRLSNRVHLFFGNVESVANWVPEPGMVVRQVRASEFDRLVADGHFNALHHVGLWLLVKRAGLVAPH